LRFFLIPIKYSNFIFNIVDLTDYKEIIPSSEEISNANEEENLSDQDDKSKDDSSQKIMRITGNLM
jgi:hypothetical protein